MRVWFRTWIVWCLSVSLWAAEKAPEYRSAGELQAALGSFTRQEKFQAAQLGVKVVSLSNGSVVFESNAGKLLKPASNGKLFSGALALARFGPEHRVRTSVYSAEKPAQGVVRGDLVVYGRGDFSFSARFHDGKYEPILDRLVQAITASGVKEVTGDLVADETYFSGAPFGASWTWDDLNYYYGAEVSALSIQDNVVDLKVLPGASREAPGVITPMPALNPLSFVNKTRTGKIDTRRSISIYRPLAENRVLVEGELPSGDKGWMDAATVSRPALWFAQMLKEELARRGVVVRGQIKRRAWPDSPATETSKMIELAFTESPPMSELVSKMMKPSQNLYAQLLLLMAGKKNNGEGDSETRGLRELNLFLKELGINRGEALLEEGSGLSRGALVTPNAIVKLLLAMRSSPVSKPFIESLPVGGIDGTLRSRFGEAGLRGNIRAKTGTIRYVNTLSGFMTTIGGEQLAFSILLNNYYNAEGSGGRAEVDEIVRMLYQLRAKAN